jgi:archaellum component FlaD/FlaE
VSADDEHESTMEELEPDLEPEPELDPDPESQPEPEPDTTTGMPSDGGDSPDTFDAGDVVDEPDQGDATDGSDPKGERGGHNPEDTIDEPDREDDTDDPAQKTEGDEPDPEDDTEESGRPHLDEFPGGYVADLTALEWLEFLTDTGGTSGARDALAYYVDIGWISPAVEDDLDEFLDGIRVSDADGGRVDPGTLSQFDPAHHRRSLAYVARLAGDGDEVGVLERVGESRGPDSLGTSVSVTSPAADGGDPEEPDSAGGADDGI